MVKISATSGKRILNQRKSLIDSGNLSQSFTRKGLAQANMLRGRAIWSGFSSGNPPVKPNPTVTY
jgi:hypothetical protein